MTKDEALKLALNKAFQLGQRYCSWADSEYSSHWKKADAAKAEFDQLVQDTINAALAEQPAQQCRTDGRCQYAIDSGAEGMGHCPKGKCVMPAQQALDKMAENARELGLHYDPAQHGPVHSTQISKVWWGIKENT